MATTTTKSKITAAELRDWPLMENNIAREDLDAVIKFLQHTGHRACEQGGVEGLKTFGRKNRLRGGRSGIRLGA